MPTDNDNFTKLGENCACMPCVHIATNMFFLRATACSGPCCPASPTTLPRWRTDIPYTAVDEASHEKDSDLLCTLLNHVNESIRTFRPSPSLANLPQAGGSTAADGCEEIDIVLSGGGLKGYFVIGARAVLEAQLQQRGLRFRRIAGASAGAWAAMFMASGVSTAECVPSAERVRRLPTERTPAAHTPSFTATLPGCLVCGGPCVPPRTVLQRALIRAPCASRRVTSGALSAIRSWLKTYTKTRAAFNSGDSSRVLEAYREQILPWLVTVLPRDAYLRCCGRCFISITVLDRFGWLPRNMLVSEFESNEDLVNACFASSCIPFVVEHGFGASCSPHSHPPREPPVGAREAQEH